MSVFRTALVRVVVIVLLVGCTFVPTSRISAATPATLDAKGIERNTVDAYEKRGAVYGGWVKQDLRTLFQEGRESADNGLPGFRFRTFPRSKLPEVEVPFGLDLNLSNVKDAELKELAGLKNLTVLDLRGRPLTAAGLKEVAGFKSLTALRLHDMQGVD